MKATVLLACLPEAQSLAAGPRLQRLGACVLRACDTKEALRHVRGGAVDAMLLDPSAARRSARGAVRLLEAARRQGVLIMIGGWPTPDGAFSRALLAAGRRRRA